MKKHLAALSCGVLLAGSMACGDVDDAPDEEASAIQLATSADKSSDVDEMKYNVYKIDVEKGEACPSTDEIDPSDFDEADPLIEDKQKKLKEDLKLPAGIPAFEDSPFHEDSQHEFADLFAHVKAGCYYVHVQPMTRIDEETKEKSKKCLPTWGTLEVEPNDVTEKVLISQCKQKKAGGIMDIVAALNKPPKVSDADLEDNKFNECPAEENPTETYCVTATEPDKDPMNMNWVLADDDGLIFDQIFYSTPFSIDFPNETGTFHEIEDSGIVGAQLVEHEDYLADKDGNRIINSDSTAPDHRVLRQCLEIEFERLEDSTQHNFGVVVYDKLYENAALTTFEDYFEALGIYDTETGDPILSRDYQSLLKYVEECPDGGELRECNQTMGYWKHLPNNTVVEKRWTNTGFEPFDEDEIRATRLCDSYEDGLEATWLDIIRNPAQYKNHYYNLARQYITAELNWAKFGWVDNDHPTITRELLDQVGDLLNQSTYCTESSPPSKSTLDSDVATMVDDFSTAEDLQSALDDFNDKTCPVQAE